MRVIIPSLLRGKTSWELLFGVSVLRLLMDLVYSKYVVQLFGYMGFNLSVQLAKYTISWIVLVTCFVPAMRLSEKC